MVHCLVRRLSGGHGGPAAACHKGSPRHASARTIAASGGMLVDDSFNHESQTYPYESIDTPIVFRASRFGKQLDGSNDYLNCPFDQPQYETFLDALMAASSVPAHIEQDTDRYFEACLPIEEIARRGRDTLRFGPMKPMGLTDPRTVRRPYAVVQLRAENARCGSHHLVGFQNQTRFAEQQPALRLIPGLHT